MTACLSREAVKYSVERTHRKAHLSCLLSAGVNVSESVFQGEAVDLANVPAEYHDLKEVFSKFCAANLPPHRPYDRFSAR